MPAWRSRTRSADLKPALDDIVRNAKGVRLEKRNVARPGAALATKSASRFVRPCEPTLTDRPPAGADWSHEVKDDGFRIPGSFEDMAMQ